MASPKENPQGIDPSLISINPEEILLKRSTIVRAEQIDLSTDQPSQYLHLLKQWAFQVVLNLLL